MMGSGGNPQWEPTTDYRLPTDYRLDYRLPTTDYRLSASGPRFRHPHWLGFRRPRGREHRREMRGDDRGEGLHAFRGFAAALNFSRERTDAAVGGKNRSHQRARVAARAG